MEIKFIGTGGAFNANYINSSALLSLDGKKYLIDCGHSVFPELVKRNITSEIDGILITHLHDDHVGSLGTLGFYGTHILNKKYEILLPVNASFVSKVKQLLSLTMVNYEDYFEVKSIDNKAIQAIETTHQHYQMESFSYLFTEMSQCILYSGDLGNADFLFEEVVKRKIRPDQITIFHDTSFIPNGGHAFYKDLMLWQKEFSIYAYHCDPDKNPEDNTLPLVHNSAALLF